MTIEHPDPLGLQALRRLPATPCSQCDRETERRFDDWMDQLEREAEIRRRFP